MVAWQNRRRLTVTVLPGRAPLISKFILLVVLLSFVTAVICRPIRLRVSTLIIGLKSLTLVSRLLTCNPRRSRVLTVIRWLNFIGPFIRLISFLFLLESNTEKRGRSITVPTYFRF